MPTDELNRGLTTKFPHEKIGYHVINGELSPVDEKAEETFSDIMIEAAARNLRRLREKLAPKQDLSL